MIEKNKIMRPAIAMIELIFAIVIMGIILMSAPMLISTASKSGYVAIQQESINEAASQVNMIMGYQWDENDVDERYIDPILRVSNGDADLEEEGNTSRRLGTPQESYRSFARSDGDDNRTASTTLGLDGTEAEENDIDDFSGTTVNLVLVPELDTLDTDYIETNISIERTVTYSDDTTASVGGYNASTITYNPFGAAAADTTNIKLIKATLKSNSGIDELEKEITLRAFSCNIGGYKLEEREF